jgi:hypothetical protein
LGHFGSLDLHFGLSSLQNPDFVPDVHDFDILNVGNRFFVVIHLEMQVSMLLCGRCAEIIDFIVDFVGLLNVVMEHFSQSIKLNLTKSTVIVELLVDILDLGEVVFCNKNRGLLYFAHSKVDIVLNFLHLTQVIHDEFKNVLKALRGV